MKNKPLFWRLNQLLTILLYELLVFGGYAFRIPWLGWALFGALMLLHIVELKTAFRIGRKHKLKTGRILLMTLLFGFTWWLPLKRGILNK
jgi:hypothetical protein